MARYLTFKVDLVGGDLTLLVLASGDATLRLTASLGDVPEIGVYHHRVEPEALRWIFHTVDTSAWRGLPPPPEMPPDTPTMAIGEGDESDPEALPVVHSFQLSELPPPLEPVMAMLHEMVGRLRGHPREVLAATARWIVQPTTPTQTLKLRIRLRNRGVEPSLVAHPASVEAGLSAGILLVRPETVPTGESSWAHARTLELAGTGFRQLPAGEPPPIVTGRRWLELPSLGAVDFEVERQVFLAPGRYAGSLRLHFPTHTRDPDTLVYGTIMVDLDPLHVTPPHQEHP